MVDERSDLSDIDKSYYLVGCLKGIANKVICGIPIYELNYYLCWSTLKAQFDKPRFLASSLIENVCNVPIISKESFIRTK